MRCSAVDIKLAMTLPAHCPTPHFHYPSRSLSLSLKFSDVSGSHIDPTIISNVNSDLMFTAIECSSVCMWGEVDGDGAELGK